MKDEIAQAFLAKVLSVDKSSFDENHKFFQAMASYKYDNYQQYFAGKRFIESFALWLNQFSEPDRKTALELIRKQLIFTSAEEMNALVASCYPDKIKNILIKKISSDLNIPDYKIHRITSSPEFKVLLRKSLFCGLSDGARMEVFRRANSGIISHEQIYQTYELSEVRANKMQDELKGDLKIRLGRDISDNEGKFTNIFLLDDFSASGSSYLKVTGDQKLKGKIAALYSSIFREDSELKSVFDVKNLQVHILLYLCTQQAYDKITEAIPAITEMYKNTPVLHAMHVISNKVKISTEENNGIVDLCMKSAYYDPSIEDRHTGAVQLGYKECALPVVLHHNTPNNSLSILWAYENLQFKGLFPRIPRHRDL